ncbi:MAG TPA: hypothetical protein VGB15_11035 [Longimicrobium sp.]
MQRHLVLTAAALALAAAAPGHAEAQTRPVTVIVGLGPSHAARLGGLPGPQGPVQGRLLGATTPMLGIQAPTALRGVGLRLAVQHSNPTLALQGEDGFVTSGHVGVTTVTADAVIDLPHVLGARPYLLAGGGVRRYDFDEDDFRGSASPITPVDEMEPLLHLGAGVAWRVGRADLFAEASSVSTKFRTRGMDPGGRSVGTFGYTLGVRLPLGRGR